MGMLKVLGNVNKEGLVNGAIKTLQTMQKAKSPEEELARTLSMKLMKDEDIDFLIRSFTKKYGLQGLNLYVEPEVEEGTFLIKKWCLMLNGKIVFKESGLDKICSSITSSVVTPDQEILKKLQDIAG